MIRRNSLLTLLLLVVMLPVSAYPLINSTYSIQSLTVKNIFKELNQSTLVIVNIDNTLITPKSTLFSYDSPDNGFVEEMISLKQYDPSIVERISTLIAQREMILLENNWPEFINSLKEKGIMVFGITKLSPPCKMIKDFPQWQAQQLVNLGVNFTPIQGAEDIVYKFSNKDPNSNSLFAGIVFADLTSKSEALKAVLKLANLYPKNIVFFSNKKSDLEEMNLFLATLDINYYGIEYLRYQQIAGSYDKDLANLQKQALIKTNKWYEDDVAKELLLNRRNNINQ